MVRKQHKQSTKKRKEQPTTASTPVSLSLTSGRHNIVWKLRIRKMSAVDVLFIDGLGNITLRPNSTSSDVEASVGRGAP